MNKFNVGDFITHNFQRMKTRRIEAFDNEGNYKYSQPYGNLAGFIGFGKVTELEDFYVVRDIEVPNKGDTFSPYDKMEELIKTVNRLNKIILNL